MDQIITHDGWSAWISGGFAFLSAVITVGGSIWTAHKSRKASGDLEDKKNSLKTQLEQYKRELDRQAKRDEARYNAESALLPRYWALFQSLKARLNEIRSIEDSSLKQDINNFIKLVSDFTKLEKELENLLQENCYYLDTKTEEKITRLVGFIEKHFSDVLKTANPCKSSRKGGLEAEKVRSLFKSKGEKRDELQKRLDENINSLKEFLRSRKLSYISDEKESASAEKAE